jgi:hypothetical protein
VFKRTFTKRNTRDDCGMLAYVMTAWIACAPFQPQIHLGGISHGYILYSAVPHTQQHQLELRESGASGPLSLLHPGGHAGVVRRYRVVRVWLAVADNMRDREGGVWGIESGYGGIRMGRWV